HVDLVVQRLDQSVDAFVLNDRMEFRALRRELADRAVEVYVGDLPRPGVLAHSVIETHRITLRFDDFGLHDNFRAGGLLPSHLELLARITVEPVGISRRDAISESLRHLLLLGRRERCPGWADGEAGH